MRLAPVRALVLVLVPVTLLGACRPAATDAAPADAASSADAGGGADASDATSPSPACAMPGAACNGDDALCARPYDLVSYPTTHNAMSNEDEGWLIPNQHHGLARQLADGVRGLMLDSHYFLGSTYLCHGVCDLGSEPLADGLAKLRAFLETCPREVVTIIFESYISAADTEAAFVASGLAPYAHTQMPGAPWPTLAELIDAGTPLVVFSDGGGVPGAPAWYHDVWAFAWDTAYAYDSPADLDCGPNRGDPNSSLFILNHFLTNPLASPANAEMINHNPLFFDRAEACELASGSLPNFPAVDFYDIGDLFDVARSINGLP